VSSESAGDAFGFRASTGVGFAPRRPVASARFCTASVRRTLNTATLLASRPSVNRRDSNYAKGGHSGIGRYDCSGGCERVEADRIGNG
jgi:hypothetical protein